MAEDSDTMASETVVFHGAARRLREKRSGNTACSAEAPTQLLHSVLTIVLKSNSRKLNLLQQTQINGWREAIDPIEWDG